MSHLDVESGPREPQRTTPRLSVGVFGIHAASVQAVAGQLERATARLVGSSLDVVTTSVWPSGSAPRRVYVDVAGVDLPIVVVDASRTHRPGELELLRQGTRMPAVTVVGLLPPTVAADPSSATRALTALRRRLAPAGPVVPLGLLVTSAKPMGRLPLGMAEVVDALAHHDTIAPHAPAADRDVMGEVRRSCQRGAAKAHGEVQRVIREAPVGDVRGTAAEALEAARLVHEEALVGLRVFLAAQVHQQVGAGGQRGDPVGLLRAHDPTHQRLVAGCSVVPSGSTEVEPTHWLASRGGAVLVALIGVTLAAVFSTTLVPVGLLGGSVAGWMASGFVARRRGRQRFHDAVTAACRPGLAELAAFYESLATGVAELVVEARGRAT